MAKQQPESNNERRWRGLLQEIAGFVSRQKKPRKVSVTSAAENQTKNLSSNNHTTETRGPVRLGDHKPRISYDQQKV